MTKLTKAQLALLEELPRSVADYYPPAKKLVELGFAAWSRASFGDCLVITGAGREARTKLKAHPPA